MIKNRTPAPTRRRSTRGVTGYLWRADFDDARNPNSLPFKKARPGQRCHSGPKCLSPDRGTGNVRRGQPGHASDIFAFPAVGEMLTLAMQEAMACGLPVVTTAEEGYEEYSLDPSGIVLVSPEPQVLRSTFLNILADSKRMKQMQVYSRHLAEQRFDWHRNAECLASDYNYACDSYRAPVRNDPTASLEPPLPSAAELTHTKWR